LTPTVRTVALILPALVASAAVAAPASQPASTPASQPASAPAADGGTRAPQAREEHFTIYEFVVVGRPPLAKDRTGGDTRVEGQRLRESSRASTFEAVAQEAGDMYVPGRGVGLHGISNGATGVIHIRGLGGSPNSQVLVVEDGVPDYQGIFGHPIPDAYTSWLLDEALVVKGGDSTLYGTNAMGGVLVLRSRFRAREGIEVTNDAAVGSYATVRETAAVLARVGPWDLVGAVSAFKTDGHREGAGGDDLALQLAVRYRLTPALSLTLREKLVHLEGGDPGPVTHPTSDHWFDVWRETASLLLAWDQGRVRFSATPYLNVGITRLYDGYYARDAVGGGIAEGDIRLHRRAQLLVGTAGEGVGGRVTNRISGETPAVRTIGDVALYEQLTLRPMDRVALTLGTRELYSTAYGFVFLYKGGARCDLAPGLALRSRVTRNFRQPTIRELYLPYPTANPDLKPEYALNWDLGLDYTAEHFEASCSVYRTEARDLIKYFGVWPAGEVVNIDHLVIWGVEGRVSVKRLGPVSAFIAGDWQDVGRYTRQNPDAKVSFTVEATKERGPHLVMASLTGEWVHGLFMADYGRQPIPGAFVMDAAVRYRYTSHERRLTLEPYLLLRNFLDRSYGYVAGYPMPGFNVLLGLRVGM
jgi:outer membrane cobalamin receptor